MKSGTLILVIALCIPYVAGCGSKGPDATDSAFENGLAKAEAANKGAANKGINGRKLPPMVAARLGKGALPSSAGTGAPPPKSGG